MTEVVGPAPETDSTGVSDAVAGFRRAEAALDAMLADAQALQSARTSLDQASAALSDAARSHRDALAPLTEAAARLTHVDLATKADVAAITTTLNDSHLATKADVDALNDSLLPLASAELATRAEVVALRRVMAPIEHLPDTLERIADRVDAIAAERVLHRFDELEADRAKHLAADGIEHRAALDRAVVRITATIEEGRPSLDLAAIGDRVGEEVERRLAGVRAEQHRLAGDAREAVEATTQVAIGQRVLRRIVIAQAIAVLVLLAVVGLIVLYR